MSRPFLSLLAVCVLVGSYAAGPAPAEEGAVLFIRGDVDADGTMNITDPIVLLRYLFQSGTEPSCLVAADVDASGDLNVADALYALNYLFARGPHPGAPFPTCGVNPEPETTLGCEDYAPCAVVSTPADDEPADDPPDGNEDPGGALWDDYFWYDPGMWFDNYWDYDPWDWGGAGFGW